jgi:CRP/FNR family cyclic AMP-dependent transcriptional regulator
MSEHADYQRVCNISVCAELDDNESRLLAEKMIVVNLTDGELLVKEGGSDQRLIVLITGKLAVYSTDINGKDTLVYTMKEGECAGTRAFVDRAPRKATLRAVGKTTVYTLSPKDFETLLDSHPRLVYKVMRALFRVTHVNLMRMNQETQQLSNYINKTQGRY